MRARAATSDKDFEEFEGESEPNMRFSHALIVVLVLHVLAVGGVFAFNSLKARHLAPDRAKPAATAQAPAADAAKKASASAHEVSVPAGGAQTKTAAKSQAEPEIASYTVVAGDTLKRIAATHKTSIEAIEQANSISSTATLRVGQALRIPVKSAAPKPDNAALKVAEPKAPAAPAKAAETRPSATTKAPDPKTPATPKVSDAKPAASPAPKPVEAKPAPKPAAEPAKADAKPASSDKTYTVAKGDNPYSIAKKLKVGYNDLLKANDIKDPTKLQIGQVLIVP